MIFFLFRLEAERRNELETRMKSGYFVSSKFRRKFEKNSPTLGDSFIRKLHMRSLEPSYIVLSFFNSSRTFIKFYITWLLSLRWIRRNLKQWLYRRPNWCRVFYIFIRFTWKLLLFSYLCKHFLDSSSVSYEDILVAEILIGMYKSKAAAPLYYQRLDQSLSLNPLLNHIEKLYSVPIQ